MNASLPPIPAPVFCFPDEGCSSPGVGSPDALTTDLGQSSGHERVIDQKHESQIAKEFFKEMKCVIVTKQDFLYDQDSFLPFVSIK